MPVLLTRKDIFGTILQAGPVDMGPEAGTCIVIGTNSREQSSGYLKPQDALEFADYLADLAIGSGAVRERPLHELAQVVNESCRYPHAR